MGGPNQCVTVNGVLDASNREFVRKSVDMDSFAAASLRNEYKPELCNPEARSRERLETGLSRD
jgi:hypothetical protein